jgi:formiminoglutamase
MPHVGTDVPDDIKARLNAEGLLLRDTDWHVDRLYDGLLASATIVRATFHRYVIDANRDPAGVSLYPGQNTTELVPTTNFDGAPIWIAGAEPDGADITARTLRFHAVYHQALGAEIARVKAQSGVAILYDCHSIRSQIPHLFGGALPDMNIGTNDGATCAPALAGIVRSIAAASPYSHVVNGRFKGGWTTRHYGRPGEGVHAIQMELAQANYLTSEAPPFDYDATRAERLRGVLRDIVGGLEEAAPALRGAVRAKS